MNTYITILLRRYLKQYFILNLPSVCQIRLPLGSEQRAQRRQQTGCYQHGVAHFLPKDWSDRNKGKDFPQFVCSGRFFHCQLI